MSVKTDRRDYLQARGWRRLHASGSQMWIRPEDPHHFYSLAAAYRVAQREESA